MIATMWKRTLTGTESAGSASLSGPQRDEREKASSHRCRGRDVNRISTGPRRIES